MQANEKKVLILLAMLAEQAGEKVSEARLDFTAEALCAIGADEACLALRKLLETARRFPTVAEVKAIMGLADPTARDTGNDIASVIIAAITRCGVPAGPIGQQALHDMLGDAARRVVQKLGGWSIVVDQAAENLTALRAQIRDMAEGCVRTGQVSPDDVPSSVPGYCEALVAAGEKVGRPELPEARRRELEAQRADIERIRHKMVIGEITEQEALRLRDYALRDRALECQNRMEIVEIDPRLASADIES